MKSIFHRFLPAVFTLLLPLVSVAQQLKLGNNPSTINKAAVLELESNAQGLLLTRITDTTVAPLTTAQDGTILFYKGDNSLRVRSGGIWRKPLFSVDTTDIASFSVKVRSLFSGTAPITYSNGVIGISQASGTTNGYLSGTDWTTFNNKLSTVDTTNIASFSVKVRSLFSGTAPITYSNGVIGISQASGTTNGYLSGTDWTTFNNKLSTIDTTNIANFYVKVRSLLNAGTGVTYNSVTGTISISGSAAGGSWLLGGNGVTSMQSLGTTTGFDLPFITNNTERMRITSAGSVGIGSSTFSSPNPEQLLVDGTISTTTNLIRGKGLVNNSLQFSITNAHGGPGARSDMVAYSNNGNSSSNFIDMGINSAGNNNSTIMGGGNAAFLYATGRDMMIGNGSSGRNLIFFTGGTVTTNEAMRVDPTGNVGIANTAPQAKLDVGGNFKLGASGTVVSSMIKSNFALSDNITNITNLLSLTKTAAVAGANLNASVIVNPRTALPQGLAIAYAFVSAVNTITINFTNTGAGAGGNQKLGSVTFDVTIINP